MWFPEKLTGIYWVGNINQKETYFQYQYSDGQKSCTFFLEFFRSPPGGVGPWLKISPRKKSGSWRTPFDKIDQFQIGPPPPGGPQKNSRKNVQDFCPSLYSIPFYYMSFRIQFPLNRWCEMLHDWYPVHIDSYLLWIPQSFCQWGDRTEYQTDAWRGPCLFVGEKEIVFYEKRQMLLWNNVDSGDLIIVAQDIAFTPGRVFQKCRCLWIF